MIHNGLVDEVRELLRMGLQRNPSASRAIGYREVIEYLEGRLPEEKLAAEITTNTRKLVKKQRTWFRTQLPPHQQIDAASLRSPDELFASEGG